MTRLMSWLDRERYSRPLHSLVVSLLSRVHSCPFSEWRRTVQSKFFDTQVPSVSTKHFCSLATLASCSRLCCNGHSLTRIGRIENSSCSACGQSSQDTSHLILYCPAMDSALLVLWRRSVSLRPLVQALESFLVFRHAPIPRKGSGNNNNFVSFSAPSFVPLAKSRAPKIVF